MQKKGKFQFHGFSPKAINFLKNIKKYNNKEWSENNRNDFQKYLLEPMQNLVVDLSPFMLLIDPNIEVRPVMGKTISRIYRDVRFSKDKSPYRSTMWITFKRPIKEWKDSPAYFFEITPEFYRYGMGFYCIEKETMKRFREMIDNEPEEFLKVVSFYKKHKIFTLEGEKYKKILNENKSDEMMDWYQRKNFYLVSNHKINNHLFNIKLIRDLITGFDIIAPLYNYLWRLKI
jgi:uncharacterized protein (TIGR02453 family)